MEIHHPFGNKYYTKLFNIFIKKNNLLRVIVISNSLKKYFTKNINHNFHDKFIMLPDCSSVKNYYSGLLFDEDNEKQLLDKLLYFFKNTKKIKTFSNNCYLHMKKNFSHIMFDKYFKKILK